MIVCIAGLVLVAPKISIVYIDMASNKIVFSCIEDFIVRPGLGARPLSVNGQDVGFSRLEIPEVSLIFREYVSADRPN